MNLYIDIQNACANEITYDTEKLSALIKQALSHSDRDYFDPELTIRFVDEEESQGLNSQYRMKDKPTNVLSFPFEAPPEVPTELLGDLVICIPVVKSEAGNQKKSETEHLYHLVVHGTLHLLGFDHIEESEAIQMEQLEKDTLAKFGIADPYLAKQ